MHTGYENYWLGQTGRQEPPPNLQKTNTPRNALFTAGYNNYKPVPNQTQHAMRTGLYPDYVNNYIPPQNSTASSTSNVAGTQSKVQNSHLFWAPSVADGPPPVRPPQSHTYPPQELVSSQAKTLHYSPQVSQRLQSNFETKAVNNSDPGFSHFYIGNFNTNNYYNNSSNVAGSQGNNNSVDKTPRIRIKNVYSLNNTQPSQISGQIVYDSRQQYNCSLNYLSMQNRKESTASNPYENVNLPQYRGLNHGVTAQINYVPANQQDPMQMKSYQQRGTAISPETQFHFNATKVNENSVPLPPASSTAISSSSNVSTCNVGVDKVVRIDPVIIAPPANMNITDKYFTNALSGSTSSAEKPRDILTRFDVPPTIQTSNVRQPSSNTAIPSHYQVENKRQDTTSLNLRNLLSQKPSSQYNFNTGQSVVDNSSSNNSVNNSNSNIVRNIEVVAEQSGPSLTVSPTMAVISTVFNKGEKTQCCKAPGVVPNAKRPSGLTLENPKSKIPKKEEPLTIVETDSQRKEIKVEISDELNIVENSIPKINHEGDLKKVEESEKEEKKQSQSENVKHLKKNSVDESVVNNLTDGDIERSIFFSKKPGPKSKTMPKALQAAKSRIETFEKLKSTDNIRDEDDGDKEKKKLGLKYEHKINRDKLDRLKEYIISLKKIEKVDIESDDSVRSCESACSNKEKNNEVFNRRRKVSKSAIVKNRNNSREMISLVSHKNGKVEICKRLEKDSESESRRDGDLVQIHSNNNKQEAKEGTVNISSQEKTKNCILTSPTKREETAIMNTMRAFQKLDYHYCVSCDLVSSNSSFWINVVTAELRCLNCFKKMALHSKKGKLQPESDANASQPGEKENNNEAETVLDIIENQVPLKKPKKEITGKSQGRQTPERGKTEIMEKSKRKSGLYEEDVGRGKHVSEEHKKKEAEFLVKSRKMTNEECGTQLVLSSEEPVSTKQVEAEDTKRRKSSSKEEGGNLKPHVQEERIKKDAKHSADSLERTKRKSVLWEDTTINSEELSRKEKNMTEKTKKKNHEGEPPNQKSRNSEKDKASEMPKKKKEVIHQREQRIMETVNEIKNVIEDREKRRSEEKWRKYYTERDTKIFLMKLNDKDDSEGKRRKSTPKEKENKKTGSPREKKDTKAHEHKREQKKGEIHREKERKSLSKEEEAEELGIKPKSNASDRSQTGKIQRIGDENVPKGQRNNSQNTEKWPSKKEPSLKGKSKDTGSKGKGDSVLFAELLKKTKKLSKSLLGET